MLLTHDNAYLIFTILASMNRVHDAVNLLIQWLIHLITGTITLAGLHHPVLEKFVKNADVVSVCALFVMNR